ncbi:MAG: beta-galactosidase trimerization domain-containing protein, partial [Anaerolineae bacterium]|nr:beta-galactosidase trimerization domain-containing protein [Anaerolineae bacterium]
GLMLDWMRFVSDQVLDFYQAEIEPLRAITPDVPITTNFMRPDVGLDYWAFAPQVDVISWDSYPRWHGEMDDVSVAVETAFYHDLHRSFKQRPFLLMESTPSVTNWQGISRPKRPGMHQLASLQAVAHGSNSVQYFQWRQSRGGSEKFHGAVVSHAGSENSRTFQEVTAVGDLLAQLDSVVNSINHAEVALIYDFQNEWALNLAELPRNVDKNYQERCMAHYRPFWQRGITVDIINSTFADLSAYKLVIAPMLYMLQPGVAENLSAFVAAGGTLVTTYLTGLVDQRDLVFLGGAPGPLKPLLGLEVEETDVLFDHHTQSVRFKNGVITLEAYGYSVKQYADIIHLHKAKAIAAYEQDFYAGTPALTVNKVGTGKAYYVAARPDVDFLADFYGWLAEGLGVKTAVSQPLPIGVTAQVRTTEKEVFIFLLNFNDVDTMIRLDETTYHDALSGQTVDPDITLPAYGFRVFVTPRSSTF